MRIEFWSLTSLWWRMAHGSSWLLQLLIHSFIHQKNTDEHCWAASCQDNFLTTMFWVFRNSEYTVSCIYLNLQTFSFYCATSLWCIHTWILTFSFFLYNIVFCCCNNANFPTVGRIKVFFPPSWSQIKQSVQLLHIRIRIRNRRP